MMTIDAACDTFVYGTITGSSNNAGGITTEGATLDIAGDVTGNGTLIFAPAASL